MISIIANDESHALPAGTPLVDFLAERGQAPERVLVEYNGTALTRSEARQTILKDGDQLEVVRIVAGG